MSIKLATPYTYEALERVTHENGSRYYVEPRTADKLSSVTTILSATANNPELVAWQQRVGLKEANRVRDEATGLGSLMHEHLECYVQGVDRPRGNNLVRQMASTMADQIIERGLVNVDEVWGMEEILYYPGLYAGTTDLVSIHNGEPAICDYKTTRKMKKRDKIEDYSLQLAAYAMAHDHLYGTTIKKGVIWMVSRDLEFAEFVFEGDEFERCKSRWLDRLDQFFGSK